MVISGQKIMLTMAAREMQADDLAKEAGISRQSVYNITRKGTCKPVTLGRIARALGVEPKDLVEMEA